MIESAYLPANQKNSTEFPVLYSALSWKECNKIRKRIKYEIMSLPSKMNKRSKGQAFFRYPL